MAYRIAPSGATDNRTFYLYGYSFAINSAKAVKSLTLPHNRNVVVLAVTVSKTGSVPLTAAAPSLSPAPGAYTAAQMIALSDPTPGAVIYYTTNGATPTTNSARYSAATPLQVSSTTTIKAMAAASNYSNSAVIGATYTITSATTAPVAQTLKISGTPATMAEVGQFYSFTPTVVGPAGSSLTFKVANMPAWAQFSAATGTLSGTPTAGSAATDANIVVSVTNGATSASLPVFSIAVAPAIPARVASGTATLSWAPPMMNTNGTPVIALTGYTIYYGTSVDTLTQSVVASGANTTSYEITGLAAGTWYFAVAADAADGTQSAMSNIGSMTI